MHHYAKSSPNNSTKFLNSSSYICKQTNNYVRKYIYYSMYSGLH